MLREMKFEGIPTIHSGRTNKCWIHSKITTTPGTDPKSQKLLNSTHELVWSKASKGDVHAAVVVKRPKNMPIHLLQAVGLHPASTDRLAKLLLLWSTKALLLPAIEGSDTHGTLTLGEGGMMREHGAHSEFMFTGSSWDRAEHGGTAGAAKKKQAAHHTAVIVGGGGGATKKHKAAKGRAIAPAALEHQWDGADVEEEHGDLSTHGTDHIQRRKLNSFAPTHTDGALKLQARTDRSTRVYATLWAGIWESVSTSTNFHPEQSTSILTYGNEMATIGMKLSRQVTTGSLMMVIPMSTDDIEWKTVEKLATEMSLSKSLFSRPLTESVVLQLYQLPDRMRFQFLGIETYLSVATLASQFPAYGARFSAGIYTRGCHWVPRLLASSKQTCGQCHSSRVFTPLTGWHCKLRPNTEGIWDGCLHLLKRRSCTVLGVRRKRPLKQWCWDS
jgi:hypothetical protein